MTTSEPVHLAALAAADDAAFELARRAVLRGVLSQERVEAALAACESAGHERDLLAHLGLTDGQLAALRSEAPAEPPEVATARADQARRIGPDHLLLEVLREGGMGRVVRAWDERLGRVVAIKLPKPGAGDPLREARLAAALDHPNVARILGTGEHAGAPFIVMQLVTGQTLLEALRGQPRERLVSVVRDVAAALEHAHARGIVHRDVKPGNVMIDAVGHTYVLDFGLARERPLDGASGVTTVVAGTPSYMAPEQAAGRCDARSDVYGLGATLYEVLTGRPPFTGGTAAEVLAQVVRDDPLRPRRLAPGVPRDLEAIALRCLERDPRRRYARAAEAMADLDAWLAGRPLVHARPPTAVDTAWKAARRQPVAALLGAAALLALAFGATTLALHADALREAADEAQARARAERALRALADLGAAELRLPSLHDALEAGAHEDALLGAATARAGALAIDAASLDDEGRRRLAEQLGAVDLVARQALRWLIPPGGPSLLGARPAPSLVAVAGEGSLAALGHLVVVRDAAGRPTRVLDDHADRVTALAVSEDGATILAGAEDGRALRWSGAGPPVAVDHGAPVTALALAAGGEVVTGGADGRARRWSATGALLGVHDGPDAALLAVALAGGEVRAVSAGGVLARWPRDGGPGASVRLAALARLAAFSPDGATVVVADRQGARRHALDGRALETLCEGAVTALAIGPDGRVAVARADGVVVRPNAPQVDLCADAADDDDDAPRSLALGRDGRLVAATARRLVTLDAAGALARTVAGPGPLTGCVALPDGRVLASSLDGRLRAWSRASGDPVLDLDAGAPLTACAGRGGLLLAGAMDGRLLAWGARSAAAERAAFEAPGARGRVVACAVSDDGSLALAAGWDGHLRAWDVASGALVHDVASGSRARAADLSGGPVLACDDRVLRAWDALTGPPRTTFTGYEQPITACAREPGGRRVLLARDDGLLLRWDGADGAQPVQVGTGRRAGALAWLPGGTLALAGGDDGRLRLIDVERGRVVRDLAGHAQAVTALAVSSDGREAFSGSGEGTLRVHDLGLELPLSPALRHASALVAASALAPDGALLTGGGRGDCTVRRWDLARGESAVVARLDAEAVVALDAAAGGRLVLGGDEGSLVLVLDGRARRLPAHVGPVSAARFSPAGDLVLSASFDRSARLTRLDGQVEATYAHDRIVWCAAFTPDGEVLTGCEDGALRLWRRDGALVRAFQPAHRAGVQSCAVSADGRLVLSGSVDRTLRVWDRASGRLLRVLEGHEGVVRACAFGPDGALVLSAGDDRALRLWDRASGRLLRSHLGAHDAGVFGLALDPTGRRAVTVSSDGVVRRWEVDGPAPAEVMPDWSVAPERAARRALRALALHGRARAPRPDELPALER